MTYKVFISKQVHPSGLRLLEENGCGIMRPSNLLSSSIMDGVEEVNAILARTEPITKEMIEKAEKLKVIARHGAGFDNIAIEKANEKGVVVTNAPMENTNSVAELVVTLILVAARNIIKVNREFADGNFQVRDTHIGVEIKDKTLGIIGYGHIGKLVSEKCADGLGMKVEVYDPFLNPSMIEKGIEYKENLEDLLKESDFISLHVPLTDTTRHLIGDSQLKSMKPGSVLINASRGGVIDEKALIEALDSGGVGMAALDVFEEEPLPSNHPLSNHEKIIITPHLGAQTVEAMENLSLMAANEILRALSGKEPLNRVN